MKAKTNSENDSYLINSEALQEFGDTRYLVSQQKCACACHPENEYGGACACICKWREKFDKFRGMRAYVYQSAKNKLVIEGMIEDNSFCLRSVHAAEIVDIRLQISRDATGNNEPLKTFKTGKVVRVTIEELG